MTQSTPIPDGSVIITPMQQYEEQKQIGATLRDVANKLDTVSGKLDHYQDDQSRRMDAVDGKDGRLSKLELRMDEVERSRWKTTGATAFASAALTSGAAALILQYVLSHH